MKAEIELLGASNVWTLRDGKVARLDHFTRLKPSKRPGLRDST
jgi:hypothetical protein